MPYSTEIVSALGSPGLTVPLSLLVIVGAILLRGLYNVYLHPLRGYPGPKLWAATQLVWIYYRLTGQLVWKSIELHNKYGSVVRVASSHLSYTTETAWKPVYGLRPVEMQKNCQAGFSRPGLKVYTAHHSALLAECTRGNYLAYVKGAAAILSANKDDHSRLRRILASALSESHQGALQDNYEICQLAGGKVTKALLSGCCGPEQVF